MRLLFILLRAATGITTLIALGILSLIVVLQTLGTFAKETAGVFGAVATLFASGFQKSPQVKDPTGLDISPPQVALAVLFVSMLVSVFIPGAKNFLNGVAVMTAVAAGWCTWVTMTTPRTEAIYLPFLGMWFVYYLVCVIWAWRPRTV